VTKFFFGLFIFFALLSCGTSTGLDGERNAPSDLTVFGTINQDIQLEWEDHSSSEIGFIIERKTAESQFSAVDTTSIDQTGYLDIDVEVGNVYTYRVSAFFSDGISEWSNEASVVLNYWFEGLEFGTEETFDAVTWNIQNFPKEGQITVDYLTQAILKIDAEVYALQEIESHVLFEELVAQINQMDTEDTWNGYRASSASYNVNLAYIYNESNVQVEEIYEIYENYSRPFPRRPLVMQMTFQNEEFWLINNHFKASGDGVMNLNNFWDEETRRYEACNLLDEYIEENLADANVILMGDLNDELDDNQTNNVFWNMINEPSKYLFVDMEIAQGESNYWSFPTWPSHLDHILITNELFANFEDSVSGCETILVDEYLDNWFEYDNNISDHRPVGMKMALQ